MNIVRKDASTERKIAGGVILTCIFTFAILVIFFINHSSLAVGTLRFLIIVVFTILPASMYYVFIASRKSSLFQQYVINLYRLGLLKNLGEHNQSYAGDIDGDYIYKMRLQSYILQFEGVYGPIGKKLSDELSNASESAESNSRTVPTFDTTSGLATGPIFSFSTAVPVLVATFVIGICWMLVIPPWVEFTSEEISSKTATIWVLSNTKFAPLLGFLGAYFFSLQMLFRRFVTGDLRAKSYVSVTMRVVVAVIGAWVLQAIFATKVLELDPDSSWILVFAFVVGAFPPILWRLIREAASRFPGIKTTVPSMDSKLPVSELDGLTVWHQTRLEEEDVENTYNMANADIVDLLVHTKIPPERIIDWVDQAILYSVISCDDKDVYNKTKNVLLQCGIRSASMLDAALSSSLEIPLEDTQNAGLPGEMGIKKAALYSRSANGFTNYQLVKNWRKLSIK